MSQNFNYHGPKWSIGLIVNTCSKSNGGLGYFDSTSAPFNDLNAPDFNESDYDIPKYASRFDLPNYLFWAPEQQITERLLADEGEAIYCLTLWCHEAISRCEPYPKERYMVRQLINGHISPKEQGLLAKNTSTKGFEAALHNKREQADREGKTLSDILENNDLYDDALGFCNIMFRNLTISLIRLAALKNIYLTRLWDYYMSTVKAESPYFAFWADEVHAVSEFSHIESEESFRDLGITKAYSKVVVELEILAVTLNPRLSLINSPCLDLRASLSDSVEGVRIAADEMTDDEYYSCKQLLDLTSYRKSRLREYLKESGIKRKNCKGYNREQVCELLEFILNKNPIGDARDTCEASLRELRSQ